MLCVGAAATQAAEPPTAAADADRDPCGQAVSTADMVGCHAAQAKLWDKRLNTAYQGLTRRVSAQQGKPLLEAQRLWLRYRDANCRFYAAGAGTIARLLAADCMHSMTRQRACELESMAGPESPAAADCR